MGNESSNLVAECTFDEESEEAFTDWAVCNALKEPDNSPLTAFIARDKERCCSLESLARVRWTGFAQR